MVESLAGRKVHDVERSPCDLSGLAASTSYTMRVEAEDLAGNESSDGPEVVATTDTPPDVTDPTWPGGAVLSVTGTTETTVTVDWSANPASDDVGVVAYNVDRI